MTPMTPSAFAAELIATIERSGYSLVPTADLDRLRAAASDAADYLDDRSGDRPYADVLVQRLRAALGDRAAEDDGYVTCGVDGCEFAVERGEGRTMALHQSEDDHGDRSAEEGR